MRHRVHGMAYGCKKSATITGREQRLFINSLAPFREVHWSAKTRAHLGAIKFVIARISVTLCYIGYKHGGRSTSFNLRPRVRRVKRLKSRRENFAL